MSNLTQPELEALLYREWPRIQSSHALGWGLSSAETHQWRREDHIAGYATLNYQIERDVIVSNAWGTGQDGSVTLLEHYWSVRTRDGTQDPRWLPSLNIHVVNAYAEPPTIKHCEATLRCARVLAHAAYAMSGDCFRDERANCHVRAYVLGSEIRYDVAAFAGVQEVVGVGFHVAKYRYTPLNGFTFEESDDVERFYGAGLVNDTDNRALGERFFEHAVLPEQNYQWSGTNRGPIFDREIGVRIHDGRVL